MTWPPNGDILLIAAVLVMTAMTLMAVLYLALRPVTIDEDLEAWLPPHPPRVDSLEDEGFELLELYDDAVPVDHSPGAMNSPLAGSPIDVICTAKVRDQRTGQIELMQVISSTPSAR